MRQWKREQSDTKKQPRQKEIFRREQSKKKREQFEVNIDIVKNY